MTIESNFKNLDALWLIFQQYFFFVTIYFFIHFLLHLTFVTLISMVPYHLNDNNIIETIHQI